jgi:tetratricopeptide (TPR) repeat protein
LEIVEQCWNDFKDELRGKNFGPNGASSVLFLSTLSITHALLGNFPMAVQYGEQAYQVARDSGRAYAQIYALHALGISYLDRGEVDKAITYFQQGVDVLTSHEILFLYPGIAGELGYALALAGKIQDAHAVLGRMLAESDQMNLSFFQALGRAYLGMVCLIDNDPESAERHGLRALAIATRFGFRWIETLSMACLGSVYSHDKTINLEKAESYLRRSATLSDALSLRPEHARCLLKLSEFEYKTGQVNEGKQNLLRAVELLQEMNMERWLMEANKILGKSDWLSVN